MSTAIIPRIAEELGVRSQQIEATVRLLDDGATVPFIARYRKEATGGLDDTQLRQLEQRLGTLRELEKRRESILESIREQGQLTEELAEAIRQAETRTRLEDLYLPYRKKRRTKGQKAIEAGLEPLADQLFQDPANEPESAARAYVDADQGYADSNAVLEGARAILAERWAEDPDLSGRVRDWMRRDGKIQSRVARGKAEEGGKFRDYFEYSEPLRKIPSHRMLALLRGRNEGVLRVEIPAPDEDEDGNAGRLEAMIGEHLGWQHQNRAADDWLADVIRFTGRVKLGVRLESELIQELREQSEEEAIRVFAANLRDLLLAAPAGERPVMGIDPGLRTGCKLAVVDATGKLVATDTIQPHAPQRQWQASLETLAALVEQHGVELVAIGNGTASRETEQLLRELAGRAGMRGLQPMIVSEAGASVYSASETAAREFPDLDVSLRGAVSIARRVQDPLAELVKIEPRAIGVGQYQHDVSQVALGRSLEAVVEDCVNAVGVDANTASAELLARVAGLGPSLASRIIAHRDQHGAFRDRQELMGVPQFGARAFQQAAGFLRIRGHQPLDDSAVHPEAYPVVERIREHSGRPLEKLIGDRDFLRGLDPETFTDEQFGLPTVRDILAELEKPGRDPRPEFRTVRYREDVSRLEDLREGMQLEGVITNVTHFGAFVDIGVHQDGLVHISQLSDRFVRDPREVVRPGQIVTVRVMETDLERRRIGLSMRSESSDEHDGKGGGKAGSKKKRGAGKAGEKKGKTSGSQRPAADGALAQALREKLGER